MQTSEGSAGTERPSLVLTGSSAGGIEPVTTFIEGLPADFGAPVVVAQHLSPDHGSRLAEIIQLRSRLPVVVLEGRRALQAATVYVVGPDSDVEIADGHAIVTPAARRGAKPSIDRLFSSAAPIYGDRLIALIFSGLGQDGYVGAGAVKEHGGTVIIQEPATAMFPSMPTAIPPTVYDVIARPDAMPQLVVRMLHDATLPDSAGEEQALRVLLTQVRERTGIDFAQYKTPTIMRRLARVMVTQGASSITDFSRQLQQHPEGFNRLARAFLIKVTEFFRDAELYEELRTRILPRLLEHAREGMHELRIWSAGTSTGEEAFSLAILCDELTRGADSKISVRIFATDLDEEAIAFARRGIYTAGSLRHLPESWIDRYFVRTGDAYEVTKRIRNMTVFGQHDLGQRAPFPRVDLVLCRNVLIYFTKELQTRALQLFAFSLREGGVLVLGKAESTAPLPDFFAVENAALKVYRRSGDRVLIPPIRLRESREVAVEPRTGGTQRPAPRPQSFGRDGRNVAADVTSPFLFAAPVGFVIVDRQYDIVTINAAARALLEIHGVGVGEDIIHLVSCVDVVQLRDCIDSALRGETQPPREFAVVGEAGVPERWLQIACIADRAGTSTNARLAAVALMITDVTDSVRGRAAFEVEARQHRERFTTLEARVDDLSRRQKSLAQANEELTLVNTDLRSANEQLLVDVEEAASSNEEIETLNEEMQATNEELETLNEELQATVEELNTTNDEIEVRGKELEQLAETRERQLRMLDRRYRLVHAALEHESPFAIVEDGEIVLVSDRAVPLVRDRAVAELTGGTRLRSEGREYEVELEPITADAVRMIFRPLDGRSGAS